ncbi:MAG: saccharopine dehydrogenase NADP-binding domain-containing protein [Clostridiales bacterium]|nr:saccharopine dehydrogenase NADP-binding domain-containing protein [Clostridiales bacterium]
MKKVLVLGCNNVTKRLVEELCRDMSVVTDICIADVDKQMANDIKNQVVPDRVRITTAGVDVLNEERTLLMFNIFGPELIINMMPLELSDVIMKLAVKVKANYMDLRLDAVGKLTEDGLLSRQFEHFADFRREGLMAIVGTGFFPGAVSTIIKNALSDKYDSISEVNVVALAGDVADEDKDSGSSEKVKAEKPFLTLRDLKDEEESRGTVAEFKPHSAEDVFYIKDNKVNYANPDSDIAVDSYGRAVRLGENIIIADIFKEMPEISTVRFYGKPNSAELIKKQSRQAQIDDMIDTLDRVGLLSKEPVFYGKNRIIPIDFLKELLKENEAKNVEKLPAEVTSASPRADNKGMATVEIYVKGKKAGADKKTMYKVSLANDDAERRFKTNSEEYFDSCIALAALRILCSGKFVRAGVFTLCAFDSAAVLDELKKIGLNITVTEDKELSKTAGES